MFLVLKYFQTVKIADYDKMCFNLISAMPLIQRIDNSNNYTMLIQLFSQICGDTKTCQVK